MREKDNPAAEDEVTVLRQRIAELEQNEIRLRRMDEMIQTEKERLKIQYRLTNIPTITWQKKGNDFIVADYNITMEDFTDGLIGNFLDKPASSLYENRPDIQMNLNTCFNEHSLIKRETHYQMFTNEQQKIIIFTFIYMPPDSVISHMEDITERKVAEKKLRKSEKQQRVLSAQLMTMQERQRKHISRELHDSIGQYLTAIKFSMENTILQLNEKNDILKATGFLDAGINLLKQTIDEVRRIMMDLPTVHSGRFGHSGDYFVVLQGTTGGLHQHERIAGYSACRGRYSGTPQNHYLPDTSGGTQQCCKTQFCKSRTRFP